MFGNKYAKQIEIEVQKSGREFTSTLTKLPALDWDKEVEKLGLGRELEREVKEKVKEYLERMGKRN